MAGPTAGRIFWVEVDLKPIRLAGRDCALAVLGISTGGNGRKSLQADQGSESMAEGVVMIGE
jgi:hypothetical protein